MAAIGANCGTTLDNMELIVKEYVELAPALPIWAKPNAGMPELTDAGETVFKVTPKEMGAAAVCNVSAGARIVGGCCGSSPEHVADIARSIKEKLSIN